ncbi:oligosaccharide flippase family protein [Gordonia alkanivorans]|uniref:oligosaccharide flippase family protein n=1 Tax=Gordonia alkanivorans TaxID=84096 RepID=UPI002446DF98|nr:oligosaccharide flippase family protein [Gordonia alkanivorans]MDH3017409.1 oligosaccharide flippase family protein [Gordonia alkanivorans]MDH3042731.1 oligosaccharide flippase family protein [Gordonia alkanivorans]
MHGVVASFTVGSTTTIVGLITIPLAIKYVGAAQYGVWLALSAGALLLYYSDLGIGVAIVHFAARYRATAEGFTPGQLLSSAVGVVSVIWLALTAIVVGVLAALYSVGYFADLESAQSILVIVALLVLVSGFLTKPFETMLIGAGGFVTDRQLKFCGTVVKLSGTLVVCFYYPSVGLLALVEVVAMVLPGVFAAAIVSRRIARVRRADMSRHTVTTLWSYSYKRFAVDSIGAAILQVGTVIVAVVASPSAVSYFSAAFRLYSGIRQVVTWVVDPFRTILSKLWVEGRDAFTHVVLSFSLLVTCVSWVGCGIAIVLAPALTPLWLGSDSVSYNVAGMVSALCAALMINVLHIPLNAATDAAHRPGVFLVPQLAWLTLYFAFSILLGAEYRGLGVSVSMALSIVVVEPVYLYVAQRTLGFRIRSWVGTVFLPAALLVLPVLTSAVLVARLTGGALVWSILAAGGLVAWIVILAFVLRSRPIVADIRKTLGHAL